MIEINLLPDDLKKKAMAHFKLPEFPTSQAFLTGFALFLGLQVLFGVFAFYQRLEIMGLKSRVISLKEENRQTLVHKSEGASYTTKLRQIAFATRRKFYWSSLLNDLSGSMTKGVWLRELSITEVEQPVAVLKSKDSKADAGPQKARCLKLSGSAIGQGQETAFIGKFVKQLKDNSQFSALFSQIELLNMNQRKIKDLDAYDFDINCIFKSEAAGAS